MGWSYIPLLESIRPTPPDSLRERRRVIRRESPEFRDSYQGQMELFSIYERWSKVPCRICRKPLGEEVRFYGDPDAATAEHAVCVWKDDEERSMRLKSANSTNAGASH